METAADLSYRLELLRDDMQMRGWLPTDLAREAKVSDMTVHRFFGAGPRTVRTAKKLADALEQPLERYVIRGAA